MEIKVIKLPPPNWNLKKHKKIIYFIVRDENDEIPRNQISEEIEYWFDVGEKRWTMHDKYGREINAEYFNELILKYWSRHPSINPGEEFSPF